MSSFRGKPKPGTLYYNVNNRLDKTDKDWKPSRRHIYFTAEVDAPAKLYLANDVTFDLIGPGKVVPVWVMLWENLGLDDKQDRADGSSSFVFADTDEPSGSEPHLRISADLEPGRFEDVLTALRDGHEVSFDFGTRSEYMFGPEKPQILGYHQPSWRHDGDCLKWRNDIKRALAISYVTINTKYTVPEPPKESEAIVGDTSPDPSEETATRWNELSASIATLTQSISQMEAATVAAYRLMAGRAVWVIALLALIAIGTWFHR
jgi:hypothetical protein